MAKLTDTQKTNIILEKLKQYNQRGSKGLTNIIFPELRLGSGYSDIAQRRIDMFLISSEKGNYTTAFEIKVSRSDFLRDIKNDLKQRGARMYATNFYYVAPIGMIKAEEIPIWAGLKEYDFEKDEFRETIPAPLQCRNNPSWSLICSLIRRINTTLYSNKLEQLEMEKNYYERECNRQTCLLKRIANMDTIRKDNILSLMLIEYWCTKD